MFEDLGFSVQGIFAYITHAYVAYMLVFPKLPFMIGRSTYWVPCMLRDQIELVVVGFERMMVVERVRTSACPQPMTRTRNGQVA